MPDYQALKAELAGPSYAGLSDADAATALNAADPNNPAPKPFGFADVMGPLSADSVANIRSLPTGTDLIQKINAQDRPGIAHWLAALQASPPLITAVEAAAVAAVLSATTPGPSRASIVFGVTVTDLDVNHARSL